MSYHQPEFDLPDIIDHDILDNDILDDNADMTSSPPGSEYLPVQDHTPTWPSIVQSPSVTPVQNKQTERIHTPASVSSSRSRRPVKRRSKGAKAWRPLDLQDQYDIDTSITSDHSAWASSTSLDVHAKTFRPSSRHSGIIDRLSADPSTSTTPEPDYIEMSSGLNAYEIRADAVNATVAASFNRRELTDVFGRELPSPGVCQTSPGLINGQVHFCMHPNGDVSAHQWSSSGYQWLNIGQFSNIRKRTEGQLASDRLKGETESQSLQQNTLAYFRAVAKQREANVMRLPFPCTSQTSGRRYPDAAVPALRRLVTTRQHFDRQQTVLGGRPLTSGSRVAELDGFCEPLDRRDSVMQTSPSSDIEGRPRKRLNDFIKMLDNEDQDAESPSRVVSRRTSSLVIAADHKSPSPIQRTVLHDPLRAKEVLTVCQALPTPDERLDVLSCREILTNSRPTPQNWNGPFFEGPEADYTSKLNGWFTNENKVARQDEFFKRIVAANTGLDADGSPGVIGSVPRTSMAEETLCDFDKTTTRLMIPVVENLASYAHKSSIQRFCAPPEWCIDRSPSGNRSFFEEDWGRVPDRIGRDERYRHLAYEYPQPRYGGRSRRAMEHIVPRVPSGLKFT